MARYLCVARPQKICKSAGATAAAIAIVVFSAFLLSVTEPAQAARIKDIATISSVRDNQLVGYGLVVGLDGTGDRPGQAPFTNQSFQNMLLQFGLHIPAGTSLQLRNVAAVAISATLPPFARPGQHLDVVVSSLGNAQSLRSGALLMSPLRGADGKVYAMAQGNVIVSGFGASGADGSKIMINSTASGSIPNGATVEKSVDVSFVSDGQLTLELTRPDFSTAGIMTQAINHNYGRRVANAMDAGTVQVNIASLAGYNPAVFRRGHASLRARAKSRYVQLISEIEKISLQPDAPAARVTVNARTGTIVISQSVTVQPVAVAHGNLSVVVSEQTIISQPGAFANRGDTVKASSSTLAVNQQPGRAFILDSGASLNDLVNAINRVGAAPGDLIAILEAIKSAGALNADLDVI